MEEKNTPRRPRRTAEDQPRPAKNESLVYGKNPVTELLKSGSGVDTVLLAEGMATVASGEPMMVQATVCDGSSSLLTPSMS